MTSATRIQAAIEKFPFLKKYIVDCLESGYSLTLEFLPITPCVFFLNIKNIQVYLHGKTGELVRKVDSKKTIEQYIEEDNTYGAQRPHFIVCCSDGKVQLHIPSSEYSCLYVQMSILLEKERQKAKDDLEK